MAPPISNQPTSRFQRIKQAYLGNLERHKQMSPEEKGLEERIATNNFVKGFGQSALQLLQSGVSATRMTPAAQRMECLYETRGKPKDYIPCLTTKFENTEQTFKKVGEAAFGKAEELKQDPKKALSKLINSIADQGTDELVDFLNANSTEKGRKIGGFGFDLTSSLVGVEEGRVLFRGVKELAALGKSTEIALETLKEANSIEKTANLLLKGTKETASFDRKVAQGLGHGLSQEAKRLGEKTLLLKKGTEIFGNFDASLLTGVKTGKYKDVFFKSVDELKNAYPAHYQMPYLPKSKVAEFTTTQVETFVRVHHEGNPVGTWLARLEQVQSLTAEEIKTKFSLPSKPTHISEAHVPAGARLRAGKSNPIFGSKESAVQYEWIEGSQEHYFKNTRLLK